MCKKFIPEYHFKSIYTIDYAFLKEKGIKVLMYDLDNTLIPYHEKMPNPELCQLKSKLEEMGFIIFIVSNSKKTRVEKFAKEFGVKYVKFAKKPLKVGFTRALDNLPKNMQNAEVAFIGDQLLTDILGSNRMNFNSILVDPFNRETEALITKCNRLLESFFRKITILFHPQARDKFYKYTEVSHD